MKNLIIEYPSWAYALCPLIGLGFAVLLYYKDRRIEELSKSLHWVLGFLRFALVTIIVFLILGPLVRYFQTEIEPPAIVLAIDNSESVVLTGDSIKAREDLDNFTREIQKQLGGDFALSTYLFGQKVTEGGEPNFSEPVTNISDVFESIKSRYANRNLGAIILATDGIYNRGSNPRYALTGITAPVYTVALGDTTRRRDLLVAEVATNRIAFLGNKFPIEARLRADKLEGQIVEYTLLKGKDVVETGSFTSEEDRFEKNVRFLIDATEPGLHRYTIRIKPVENEITLANNERAVFIEVIDGREKILILGNAPHPDVAAMRNAISSNENYEVDVAYAADFKGNIRDYNVIITHGLPSRNVSPALISEIQKSEIPVFAILSAQTHLPSLTNLGLGVQISSDKRAFNDVGGTVNPNFRQFGIEENFDAFLQDAPPLRMPFGEWRFSNASEPVLYQKIGSIPTRDPLLIVTKTGEQKSATLLGEGIWRWRMYDYAVNENHEAFDKFFGSIVQYLSVKDDKRLFRVQAPSEVMENESILLTAELYNAVYEPVNDSEVNIVFTDEDGRDYPFVFSRTEQAYRLDAGILPVGNYTFTASTQRNGENHTDKGRIVIRPFALEGAELTARHNLLHTLSEATGGIMVYTEDVDELVNTIKASKKMKPVSYSTEILSSFLNFKWPFFLILALLSIEWFIRKRSGHY